MHSSDFNGKKRLYCCRIFFVFQVAANKRSEEARSLQGSWFPSVMRRMLIMVQGKDGGEMPRCMTKLAAALHKVTGMNVGRWDDAFTFFKCVVHAVR